MNFHWGDWTRRVDGSTSQVEARLKELDEKDPEAQEAPTWLWVSNPLNHERAAESGNMCVLLWVRHLLSGVYWVLTLFIDKQRRPSGDILLFVFMDDCVLLRVGATSNITSCRGLFMGYSPA